MANNQTPKPFEATCLDIILSPTNIDYHPMNQRLSVAAGLLAHDLSELQAELSSLPSATQNKIKFIANGGLHKLSRWHSWANNIEAIAEGIDTLRDFKEATK